MMKTRAVVGERRLEIHNRDLSRTLERGERRALQQAGVARHQNAVGWIGMSATLTGVAIQSLLPDFTRYSFLIFLSAALLWFCNGMLTRNRPLMYTQVVLIVLNCIAAYRWFTV